MQHIFVDPEKCTGCKTCEISCRIEHSQSKNLFTAPFEPHPPRTRIFVESFNDHNFPIQCRHCSEPPCVSACMSGALIKNVKNGLTEHIEEKCIGCFMCVMACPFGVINRSSDSRIIVKCDRCPESGYPQCVKSCPTHALTLQDIPEEENHKRRQYLTSFFQKKEV